MGTILVPITIEEPVDPYRISLFTDEGGRIEGYCDVSDCAGKLEQHRRFYVSDHSPVYLGEILRAFALHCHGEHE